MPSQRPSLRPVLASLFCVLGVLGVAAGMVLLSPNVALACSCVPMKVADQVDQADTVVGGTLEWTSATGDERSYGLRIDEVYKGIAGVREILRTPAHDAACGLGELATDQRYVFFLEGKHPGRMTATACGGSAPYTSEVVQAVQAETDGPFEPLPTLGDEPPVAEGADPIRVVGIGAFVVAAGFAVFALVRRRRNSANE